MALWRALEFCIQILVKVARGVRFNTHIRWGVGEKKLQHYVRPIVVQLRRCHENCFDAYDMLWYITGYPQFIV